MSEKESKLADVYEKLAQKTKTLYEQSSEKTLAALEIAIEKSRESLEKAGEISRSEGEKLKLYLRRDLEQVAKQVDHISVNTKEKLTPKIRKAEAGFYDLTAYLAHGASDLFTRLGDWADSTAVYHTGQVTAPGVLQCRACKKEMHFKKSGNIPPCPACHKTEFRRIS